MQRELLFSQPTFYFKAHPLIQIKLNKYQKGNCCATVLATHTTFSQALSARVLHLSWLSSTIPFPSLYLCRNNRSSCLDELPDWKWHGHCNKNVRFCKRKEVNNVTGYSNFSVIRFLQIIVSKRILKGKLQCFAVTAIMF